MVPSLDVAAAVDANRLAGDEIAFDEREHTFGDFDLAAPRAERSGLLDARSCSSVVPGGARIGPGAIALTRILSAASSSASISVSAITPAFAT
jgi:hypothetical protein